MSFSDSGSGSGSASWVLVPIALLLGSACDGQGPGRADWAAEAMDCRVAGEGCPCAGNQPPIACRPEASGASDGLCYEGTRYCRQGRFGPCEGVRAFARPSSAELAALVDPEAEHAPCSDCDPNCFTVQDNLEPASGALSPEIAEGVIYHGSGAGLALEPNGEIPSALPPDSLPEGALYLGISEGLVGTALHTMRVSPEHSDVYLLIDRSTRMAEEVTWLRDGWSSGSALPAGTPCASGEPLAGDVGLAGALECSALALELGVGMFRDLPFAPYAEDQTLPQAQRAADAQREIAFRHHADQSADLTVALAALGALGDAESSGDPDVAGSQIPALHAIATSAGMFMGLDRPLVPDAAPCSDGRFGYPCFRADADPIVVLLTDAPFHNGPNPSEYPYDYLPEHLQITTGTQSEPGAVPEGHDDWDRAFLVPADAASALSVYEGSTAGLGNAIAALAVGCGAHPLAPNAVFQFDVATPSRVLLSTQGSSFATALAVLTEPVHDVEFVPGQSDNELFESAQALSDVTGRQLAVNGDTTDMSPDYQGSLFGAACGANTLAPDAVFELDVSSAAGPSELELTLEMTDGDDSVQPRPVLAVYEQGSGPLPRWPAHTTALVAAGNDDAQPENVYLIPSGEGFEYVTVRGDTSALAADFDASVLGGAACGPDDAAPDAVFLIHVETTRTLRFDTEGSSFDTVLSLHEDLGSASGGFLACDDDGVLGTAHSVLERTLAPGDYHLVIKGKRAVDAGAYQLTVRDVDAVRIDERACDAGSGTGDPARVRFVAEPGRSYYALVKGAGPSDRGHYTLGLRDLTSFGAARLGCDAQSGPDGSSRLELDLEPGRYYAVIKGRGASEAGDYRLALGAAAPDTTVFEPSTYEETADALASRGIRVATVLSCTEGEACSDAQAQARVLAEDTAGTVRVASTAAAVPAELAQAVRELESYDHVRGELLFSPDENPGFASAMARAYPDPNTGCSPGDDPASFRDCPPGATPTFLVTLENPALAPVPPPPEPDSAYAFTLRLTGERDGALRYEREVPVFVAPAGAAPPGSYDAGHYQQDVTAEGCERVEARQRQQGGVSSEVRPSWGELRFDADVRPDTRVSFHACTANTREELEACAEGAPSSGYRRVLTISAGSGAGTPCTVATQAEDCPDGYCSPYTRVCNALEGASCEHDDDCPGGIEGSCRSGPNAAQLGRTCRVSDVRGDLASALDEHDFRPFLRMRLELESLGDGSRTPAVFFWESRYVCRNVE